MNLSHVKMTRAVNKLDEIVEVKNVKNGKACDCNCIVCNSPLIARQGSKRSWHFAHDTSQGDIDCVWSGETELHLIVKEYLSKATYINVPIGIHQPTTESIHIDEAQVEMRFDPTRRIPDVTVFSRGEKIFIEVAVTHFCEPDKIFELKKNNANAIEFDFSDFYPEGDVITDGEIEQHIKNCEVTWLSVAPAGYIGSKVHAHERLAIQKLNEEYVRKEILYSRELQELSQSIRLKKEELIIVEDILVAKSPEAEDKKAILATFEAEKQRLQRELQGIEDDAIRRANISAEEQFNASFDLLKQDLENTYRSQNKSLVKDIETKQAELANLNDSIIAVSNELELNQTRLAKLKEESSEYIQIKQTIDDALKSLEKKVLLIAQTRKQLKRILPEFKDFCRRTGAPWPFVYDIDTKLNTDLISQLYVNLSDISEAI